MIAVWLWLVVVLAGLCVWVVLGIVRQRNAASRTRWRASDANVALYRQRAREIETEQATADLRDDERQALTDELGATLLSDTEAVDQDADSVDLRRVSAPQALTLAVALAVVSAVLYLQWGDPGAGTVRDVSTMLAHDPDEDTLMDVARRLQVRVDSRPDDRDSWYFLAHTLLRQERYQSAADAFAQVHRLGGSQDVDVFWAQAEFLAGKGQLRPEGREVADRALERNPNNAPILELLAMDAARRGDHAAAVRYVDRVLGIPLPRTRRAMLAEMQAKIREQMDAGRPQVLVSIDTGDPPPGARWLMVFARTGDAGPPLAVIKRPLDRDRTYDLILDDAVSMNPAMPISAAGQVRITARLTASGGARRGPDDVEIVSESIAVGPDARIALAFDGAAVSANAAPTTAAAPTAARQVPAEAAAPAEVAVDLAVDASLSVADETPVFLIARVAGGGGPPIAVRRTTVGELPARIVLTDREAMMPSSRLSMHESVEVVGRVAVSGGAIASAGDFESEPVVVTVGSNVAVVIDRRLSGT